MCFWSAKFITVYLAKVNFWPGKENTSNQPFLSTSRPPSPSPAGAALIRRELGLQTKPLRAAVPQQPRGVIAWARFCRMCTSACDQKHQASWVMPQPWVLPYEATSEPVSKWLINVLFGLMLSDSGFPGNSGICLHSWTFTSAISSAREQQSSAAVSQSSQTVERRR